MKKICILLLLTTFAGFVNAQVCTPDPVFLASASTGISPNPAVNPDLPDGMVNVPYSQTFTLKIPADTNIDLSSLIGFPFPPVVATINYLELQQPVPLPTGLTFSCEPVSCMIPGNSSGCAILQGTPTTAGMNQLFLVAMVNINVPVSVPVLGGQAISVPYVYPTFNLEILPDAIGLDEATLDHVVIYPNPNSGSFRISSSAKSNCAITIFDLSGKQVFVSKQSSEETELYTNLEKGMYLLKLSGTIQDRVIPFIVQ